MVKHSNGTNFWQIDLAQFWYIGMLYLVEFADWNSQAAIGYGCSANGYMASNGKTDAMQYHTGTTAATRNTYGFTQYRNIEGWWDNCFDFIDGCYNNADGLHVILNPNQFTSISYGILVGKPYSSYPSTFSIPTVSNFEWALVASEGNGSESSYITDAWTLISDDPYIFHGGDKIQSQRFGLFYIESGKGGAATDVGCRLQERPPKT